MTSPEHTTILNCASQLENALQSNIREVAHHLVKEGFISEEVYDDVIDPRSMLSAAAKAGMLVTGIRQKVKANSQHYEELMSYFRQYQDKYVDIIKILDDSYSASLVLNSAPPTATVSNEQHPPAGLIYS